MFRTVFLILALRIFTISAAKEASTCGDTHGAGCDPCGISGSWRNELGSIMEIKCHAGSPSSSGSLRGMYKSAVGVAQDFYELSGRYTMAGPDMKDCIVGWSVAYNNNVRGNSNSTAAWSGVYYAKNSTIYTKWILTRYTAPKDYWMNSLIGMDVFNRK